MTDTFKAIRLAPNPNKHEAPPNRTKTGLTGLRVYTEHGRRDRQTGQTGRPRQHTATLPSHVDRRNRKNEPYRTPRHARPARMGTNRRQHHHHLHPPRTRRPDTRRQTRALRAPVRDHIIQRDHQLQLGAPSTVSPSTTTGTKRNRQYAATSPASSTAKSPAASNTTTPPSPPNTSPYSKKTTPPSTQPSTGNTSKP